MCDFDDDTLDEAELDELIGLTDLLKTLDEEVVELIITEEEGAWEAVDADPNAQEGSPTGEIEQCIKP